MRALFQPLGRVLLLETDSEAVLDLARDTFGRFGPAAPDAVPDITLRLETGGVPPADLPSYRSNVLLYGFLSQLRDHGLMAVHGSALVKNGHAALLRGPSGTGKTTLAYAGARRRLRLLAEDVVWIDHRDGVWRGVPWLVHLMPDAERLFPELAGRPAVFESAGRMKLEVDLDTVRPGSAAVSARPGPVVLLDRAAGPESALERLEPAGALGLWRRCPAGTEEDFPDYERLVQTLLSAGAWRLRLGTDLEMALDLVEALLE